MARARGANAVMAAAFETTYGTPPVAGYKKLPFVSSALGDEQIDLGALGKAGKGIHLGDEGSRGLSAPCPTTIGRWPSRPGR